MNIKGLIALSYSMVLWGCQSSPPMGKTVRVVRVVSGNTLEVVSDNSPAQTVRLMGISTPSEEQEPWGIEAKQYLQDRLHQEGVILVWDGETEDRYGRSWGYVWHEGELMNEELVKEGYALAEAWIPNDQYSERFQYAEERARTLGLGIWNPENPMRLSPSEFRHQED